MHQARKLTLLTLLTALLAMSASSHGEEDLLGPPVSRFDSLTDSIYATSDPLLSDRLSFPENYEWKRELSGNLGFDYVLLNTPLFQAGSVDGKVYGDNELDLFLQWRAFDNTQSAGKIFFWGLWVQTFTDLPSGAFAKSQGLRSFPNGGATDPDKSVVAPSALWWEQEFKPVGITYRVGQLYAPTLFGSNSYLGDDRATFMNTILSTNQGTPWAGGNRGLGAMVSLDRDEFYASLGFQDAKGDQKSLDFADGKFAYLGELGWTPTFDGEHQGNYKVTVGYVDQTSIGNDPANQSGWGGTLSAQQDISDAYGFFGILRRSYGRVISNTDTAAGVGFTLKKPLGRVDDMLGTGAFYSKPFENGNGTFRDEYGIEAFWNIQLTPRLQFSPDMQLYLQPGRVNQNGQVFVAGFRFQYVL